ncbi:follistatin-related protein 5-like [Acropora muricata]|uniref:follistatin-related protein 5-like n=1 Tax=Acropora muricata TaxID=159855 RepID=UPI0034E59C7B
MKNSTLALIILTSVFLFAVVLGRSKERKTKLARKQSRKCSLFCSPGRECRMQSNGQAQCVCMSRCKKKRNPVCGSDGIFYDNHCELHRTACHFGEKISVDLDMKCFKAQERIHDCQDDKLSKMKKLILAMFDKEQRKKATTTRLIDELYFRYNKDGDHRVSSFELQKLISDYVMYPKIKELAEVCHATQWVKAEDDDKNGYLSKDEFSQSFASRPEVDILQNEEQQLSGSSLTFRCQVRGYPVPTVLWFKDQMKLNADDHVSMTPDGELHIKDLEFSDNGVYTCEAVNELGLERKQVKVKVEENVADKSLKGEEMFYVFANDGVFIINPENLSAVSRIPADDVINGSQSTICTSGRDRACNWGGAVSVNFKYVYAADFLGQRVLVFDVTSQNFVQEVKIEGYPYQLKYFRSLDAVWVMSWADESLEILTEDEDDNGTLHVITEASKMTEHVSVKIRPMDDNPVSAHGFFVADNCNPIGAETKSGYVTHIFEPGFHEVDLITKQFSKFYNLSENKCYGTFGIAVSEPHSLAFVQCYTNEERDTKAQLVIDLKENQLKALNEFIFGTSFVSPDGRFVITLNYYAILTQYIDPAGQIFLFAEIESNLLLSQLAFYSRDAGYDVYVTSRDQSAIIVLHVDPRGIKTPKFISTVGKPQQKDWVHTQRPIVIGCGSDARYLATPATGESTVVILDGDHRQMVGKVEEIKGASTIVWAGKEEK